MSSLRSSDGALSRCPGLRANGAVRACLRLAARTRGRDRSARLRARAAAETRWGPLLTCRTAAQLLWACRRRAAGALVAWQRTACEAALGSPCASPDPRAQLSTRPRMQKGQPRAQRPSWRGAAAWWLKTSDRGDARRATPSLACRAPRQVWPSSAKLLRLRRERLRHEGRADGRGVALRCVPARTRVRACPPVWPLHCLPPLVVRFVPRIVCAQLARGASAGRLCLAALIARRTTCLTLTPLRRRRRAAPSQRRRRRKGQIRTWWRRTKSTSRWTSPPSLASAWRNADDARFLR